MILGNVSDKVFPSCSDHEYSAFNLLRTMCLIQILLLKNTLPLIVKNSELKFRFLVVCLFFFVFILFLLCLYLDNCLSFLSSPIAPGAVSEFCFKSDAEAVHSLLGP